MVAYPEKLEFVEKTGRKKKRKLLIAASGVWEAEEREKGRTDSPIPAWLWPKQGGFLNGRQWGGQLSLSPFWDFETLSETLLSYQAGASWLWLRKSVTYPRKKS